MGSPAFAKAVGKARHAHDIASRARRQIAVVKHCELVPLTPPGGRTGHRVCRARVRRAGQARGAESFEPTSGTGAETTAKIVLGQARSPAARGHHPLGRRTVALELACPESCLKGKCGV